MYGKTLERPEGHKLYSMRCSELFSGYSKVSMQTATKMISEGNVNNDRVENSVKRSRLD